MPIKMRTKGAHKIRLSWLIGKKRLQKGRYRVVMSAANTRVAAFRVS
jgi:hypothetical protein